MEVPQTIEEYINDFRNLVDNSNYFAYNHVKSILGRTFLSLCSENLQTQEMLTAFMYSYKDYVSDTTFIQTFVNDSSLAYLHDIAYNINTKTRLLTHKPLHEIHDNDIIAIASMVFIAIGLPKSDIGLLSLLLD